MQQVYLHGLGQTSADWEKTMARMGAGSAACRVCPDLADLAEGREATYANLYSALSEFCGGLDGAIDLCGLSLGGVLALHYAIDYPEKVRSLVLIAAPYRMPKRLLLFQNIVFQFMPPAMFPQTGFGKPEFLRLCRSMAELDFSASVGSVACPAMVLCGEKDAANRRAAGKLADALRRAEFHAVKGAGHEVNVDAPEALAELLCDFYHRI